MLIYLFNNFFRFLSKITNGTVKSLHIINYRPTYDEDGFASSHNSDFVTKNNFMRSYNLGFDTGSSYGWNIKWRIHNACFFANYAKDLKGDFVECGTNKGMTALSIIDNINFIDVKKKFYLIDTFKGVVSDMLTDNERKKNDTPTYNDCYDEVVNTFSKFSNVLVVKGEIPEVLYKMNINKISFLHIDLNSSKAEKMAINYLWDKLVKGGVILLDDYAYTGFVDTKKMWDNFAITKSIRILTFPTGQGLIIK